MFWFFGLEACGILAPWPGIKPAAPALEGKVLTTGLPGKSLHIFLKSWVPFKLVEPPQIYHTFEDEESQIKCLHKNSGEPAWVNRETENLEEEKQGGILKCHYYWPE